MLKKHLDSNITVHKTNDQFRNSSCDKVTHIPWRLDTKCLNLASE